MATAKYSALGTASSNLAGTALNGVANGASSGFLTTYANGTNLDLYASVAIALGSLTPTTGGSITLRVFAAHGATAPDDTGSVGGGDTYTVPLTTTTGAKSATIPMVRLYPQTMYFSVTNNTGVALAASGNSVIVQPYDEAIN